MVDLRPRKNENKTTSSIKITKKNVAASAAAVAKPAVAAATSESEPDEHEQERTLDETSASVQLIDHKASLRKDTGNIFLLLLLYFLQGIPIGLAGSLPLILSSHHVSYADQGLFSFATWPFSFKLLWAPIVDSIFVKSIGRRKTWLIPTQYLIGILMLAYSGYVRELVEGRHSKDNGVLQLTMIFFSLTFLSATQDIAVDGWALTMLAKENVAWGSTCNSVGQTAGWFVGNVLFLAFESVDFSNTYVRPLFGLSTQTHGLLTIDKFMNFFGVVFIVSTTLVFIMKREKKAQPDEDSFEDDLTIKDTYKIMWSVLKLKPVVNLNIILLTAKIGFAIESMSIIKLIEAGVPKENLSLLAVPLTPLQIVLPLLISKYTNGPRPLDFFIKSIPFRLICGCVVSAWIYFTPYFKESNNVFPFYYYVVCLVINAVHSVFAYTMFVSQMSFFAQISDKNIGGTYMTFLNTITNFGGNWPSTAALYLASYITVKQCTTIQTGGDVLSLANNTCSNEAEVKNCKTIGGSCLTLVDAYYVLAALCTVIGTLWYFWGRRVARQLQALPKSAWKIKIKAV